MLTNQLGGAIFVFLLFFSSYFGTLFYMFICFPMMIIIPKTYQFIVESLCGLWQHFPAALLEFVFGTKIVVTGDSIRAGEWSLLLMNHRTRLDWLFLWNVLIRSIPMRSLKIILKSGLELIPGAGWAMQICRYIFIKRNWTEDKMMLNETFDYMMSGNRPYHILLFPEGTDLNPESKAKCDQFAIANGLPVFTYVLNPRMTGFLHLMEKMRQGNSLDAVYDITVAYPENIPHGEMDIFRGDFPRAIHFHVDRYSAGSIPYTSDTLSKWCLDLWVQKERRLEEFYRTGNFSQPARRTEDCISGYIYILYLFSLVFWVSTVIYSFLMIYKHQLVLIYVIVVSLIFFLIGPIFGSVSNLEMKLVKIRNEKWPFSTGKPKK